MSPVVQVLSGQHDIIKCKAAYRHIDYRHSTFHILWNHTFSWFQNSSVIFNLIVLTWRILLFLFFYFYFFTKSNQYCKRTSLYSILVYDYHWLYYTLTPVIHGHQFGTIYFEQDSLCTFTPSTQKMPELKMSSWLLYLPLDWDSNVHVLALIAFLTVWLSTYLSVLLSLFCRRAVYDWEKCRVCLFRQPLGTFYRIHTSRLGTTWQSGTKFT